MYDSKSTSTTGAEACVGGVLYDIVGDRFVLRQNYGRMMRGLQLATGSSTIDYVSLRAKVSDDLSTIVLSGYTRHTYSGTQYNTGYGTVLIKQADGTYLKAKENERTGDTYLMADYAFVTSDGKYVGLPDLSSTYSKDMDMYYVSDGQLTYMGDVYGSSSQPLWNISHYNPETQLLRAGSTYYQLTPTSITKVGTGISVGFSDETYDGLYALGQGDYSGTPSYESNDSTLNYYNVSRDANGVITGRSIHTTIVEEIYTSTSRFINP
jgi:hypothetical protein